MRSSVLDLGGNSFHVLVADVHQDGYVDPVLRERQMLHLGRVVADHGHIPDDVLPTILDSVEHLSELARRAGSDNQLAVATSALGDATNGREVVTRIATAIGHPVRILPGFEEARLAYLGVRAAMGVEPGGLAVLDLGGGSLELAVGTRRQPDLVSTSNLGVSRLSALVTDDPISKADRAGLQARIEEELELSGGAFATHLPTRVVAVGGTVRAMARVVAAVLEQLDVEALEVCDWGLREGVLLDAADTRLAPSPTELKDREVRRLHDAFTPGDDHDPHGAYIIENAELRGFTPVQCAQLVALVRFHSSSGIKDKHPVVRAMDDERREATHVLLALLQAADGLDRTRDQAVTGMRLGEVGDETLELHLEGRGLQIARAELARKTKMFRRVLGRELVVHTPTTV